MKGTWIFPTLAAALLVPALALAQSRTVPQVAAARAPAPASPAVQKIVNPLGWVGPQGLDKIRSFAQARGVPGTIVLQPHGGMGNVQGVWIKSEGAPLPDGKPSMAIVGYASLHRSDVQNLSYYEKNDPNPKPFKP